ncbi:MAG: antitoxin family protein [Pirellulaceae bacterium]|nr:antitoxin family protein [Pirellulaceae bacterium]
MSETIEAVFDHGVFTPCAPVSIPDGQRVTLTYVAAHIPEQPPTWPDLPPELVRNSDGGIVARGTRISLFIVLEYHFKGDSWAELESMFPTVSSGDWPRIAAYVQHNENALRLYYEEQDRIAESKRTPTPPGLTLEGLRERFQKKFGKPYSSSPDA